MSTVFVIAAAMLAAAAVATMVRMLLGPTRSIDWSLWTPWSR